MIDPLSPAQRSQRMGRIKAKNTKPELAVRRLLHKMGYRYRIHRTDLPGKPDVAFIGRRKVIFVHGCFWHQHGCGRYKMPQSSTDFWHEKLRANVARDRRDLQALEQQGWQVLVIWECELRYKEVLAQRLATFVGPVRWTKYS